MTKQHLLEQLITYYGDFYTLFRENGAVITVKDKADLEGIEWVVNHLRMYSRRMKYDELSIEINFFNPF